MQWPVLPHSKSAEGQLDAVLHTVWSNATAYPTALLLVCACALACIPALPSPRVLLLQVSHTEGVRLATNACMAVCCSACLRRMHPSCCTIRAAAAAAGVHLLRDLDRVSEELGSVDRPTRVRNRHAQRIRHPATESHAAVLHSTRRSVCSSARLHIAATIGLAAAFAENAACGRRQKCKHLPDPASPPCCRADDAAVHFAKSLPRIPDRAATQVARTLAATCSPPSPPVAAGGLTGGPVGPGTSAVASVMRAVQPRRDATACAAIGWTVRQIGTA